MIPSHVLFLSRGLVPYYSILALLMLPSVSLVAQVPSISPLPLAIEAMVLPNSPGAISSSLESQSPRSATIFTADLQNVPPPNGVGVIAGHLDKYIEPDQQVPSLRIGDKVLLGFKDSVSPMSAAGWLASAGYKQILNGSPDYGTDGKAFAQRLGAAAARDISEGIFSDSVMANVFHEDPRYYRLGPRRRFLRRAFYAATRTLITRSDNGRTRINLAYLSGNLGGAILTRTYYPAADRDFNHTLLTYGGSIGGGSLGFLVSEFFDDLLIDVHLRKVQ